MITLTTIFKIHRRFGEIVEIAKEINGTTTVCPVERKAVKIENGSIAIEEKAFSRRNWFFRKIK